MSVFRARRGCKVFKNIEEYPLILTNYEGQECIRTVSPVTADHAENIAICGDGVIDGSGDLWRPVKQFKMTERQWAELMKKTAMSSIPKREESGFRQNQPFWAMKRISRRTKRCFKESGTALRLLSSGYGKP